MDKEIRKFDFELEGEETLFHKFNGLDEEKKIKKLPEKEQAEKHIYRHPNGNIAIPSIWLRGCIIEACIKRAGFKEKTREKERVSPRIRIEPLYLDIGQKVFEIDRRGIPSGGKQGTRDICVRPLVKKWKAKGTLVTTLPEEISDLQTIFEYAGEEVGVGSNRINGYGRFKLTKFIEKNDE